MFYAENLRGFFSNLWRNFPSLKKNNYNYYLQSGLQKETPIYVDTNNLWGLYTQIPHLNNCINKKAELLSLGRLRHFKDSGEEIKDSEILKFLRHPNPLQTWEEFITQYSTFLSIYGNAFFYKLKGSKLSMLPAALWNLPPQDMKVKTTGKIFNQTDIKKIIEYYELCYGDKETIRYNVEDVILRNDNAGSNYILSESKLIALVKPLSNIVGALQTANILINKHGTYGIFYNDTKDAIGNIGMSEMERKRIEEQLSSNYGNLEHQSQITLSNNTIKFQPVGYKMKEMMLTEEIEQDAGIVYDAYGMNRNLFASIKGTGNNSGGAEMVAIRNTIQSTIVPEANDIARVFSYELGLNDKKEMLKITFDHLEALQENRKEKEYATQVRIRSIKEAVEGGLISAEEGRTLAKIELNIK